MVKTLNGVLSAAVLNLANSHPSATVKQGQRPHLHTNIIVRIKRGRSTLHILGRKAMREPKTAG